MIEANRFAVVVEFDARKYLFAKNHLIQVMLKILLQNMFVLLWYAQLIIILIVFISAHHTQLNCRLFVYIPLRSRLWLESAGYQSMQKSTFTVCINIRRYSRLYCTSLLVQF